MPTSNWWEAHMHLVGCSTGGVFREDLPEKHHKKIFYFYIELDLGIILIPMSSYVFLW
jgi:hypothetical protein